MKVNRRLFNVAEWRPVAVPSGAGLQIVEIQSGKHRISRFIDFLQIQKGMLIVWGPDVLTRSFPKGKLNAIESVFRQSQFLRREIELNITAHNGIAVDSCYCHHHRHHHHHHHHHHHLFCTTRGKNRHSTTDKKVDYSHSPWRSCYVSPDCKLYPVSTISCRYKKMSSWCIAVQIFM